MSSRIWWMNNRTMNGWSRTHLKRSESPSTVTWRALHTALNERAMYSNRDSIWNLCLDQRSTRHSEKALKRSSSKAFHVALLFPQKSSLCIPFWCLVGLHWWRSTLLNEVPLPPLIVVSQLCVLALGFVRDTLVLMDLGKHCGEH